MLIFVMLIAIIALFVCFAIMLYRMPRNSDSKGRQGEHMVANIIGDNVEGKKYVYNNYMLQNDNNMTCQIDHIVVNSNGVFVLETKNYSGKIYGNDNAKQWTQVLAYGKVKNHFYNPVRQNATHIYHLNKLLKNACTIHGYVVMISADIDCLHSDNVVTLSQLKHILSDETSTVLTTQEIQNIRNILDNANVVDKVSNQQHIDNIHRMQDNVHNNICPRCGAKLVMRKGKYGQFYGCSNYPECTFKKTL